MFLPLLLAASASASPLVVGYQPRIIRSVLYPYNPFFHYLATSPIVIDIEVDYVCEAEGVFINPEDCGSYFVCNDNGAGLKASKVSCPGNIAGENNVLAFNEETGACDWAANVEGCSVPRSAELPQEPILVDPDFEYDCTQEGVFFNPEDCGSYVTCNADSEGQLQSHKVSCAPDLLFNAELKVCDWPGNVPDCSIRSVPNDPNSPTPQPIVACTEDLQERGIPCFDAIMACADGTFRSECDPISETWWWTTQEVESEEFDCMEKEVGTYEHPDQCNMYYVCTGEHRAFRHSCAPGTMFSAEGGECMFEDEVVCGGRQERKSFIL